MAAEWSSLGEEKFESVPNCTDSYRDLYICFFRFSKPQKIVNFRLSIQK